MSNKSISVPLNGDQFRRTLFSELVYLQAYPGSMCKFYLIDGTVLTSKKPLKYFLNIIEEENLNEFFPINRREVVNLHFVQTLYWSKCTVEMSVPAFREKALTISKNRRNELRDRLNNF